MERHDSAKKKHNTHIHIQTHLITPNNTLSGTLKKICRIHFFFL